MAAVRLKVGAAGQAGQAGLGRRDRGPRQLLGEAANVRVVK